MAVFQRPEIEIPGIGRLEYFASYWRGEIYLCAFKRPFRLIIRAKRDRPSAAQISALSKVVADVDGLKHAASEPMADVHRECLLLPPDFGADAGRIWDVLVPETIEVADENYYGDGDGRIAVIISFGSTQNMDFGPAIETANGSYVGVLSGT